MFFEGFASAAHANKRLEDILRSAQRDASAPSEADVTWALQQPEMAAMLFRGREVAHAFFGQHLDLLFEAACSKLEDAIPTHVKTSADTTGYEGILNASDDYARCRAPQNTLLASSRSRGQLLEDTAVAAMRLLTGRQLGSPRVMQCAPVEAFTGVGSGNYPNRRSPWGDMCDGDGARVNMVSFVASGKAVSWIHCIAQKVAAIMRAMRDESRRGGGPTIPGALHHGAICVTRLVRCVELLEAVLIVLADVAACGIASPQRRVPFADVAFPPQDVAMGAIEHGVTLLLDTMRDVCEWVAPIGSSWMDVSAWLCSHVYATEEKWVELQRMVVNSDEVHILLSEATGVLQALACRNAVCGARIGSILHRRLLKRKPCQEEDALCDPLAPCLSAVLTVPYLQLFPANSVGEAAVCAFLGGLVFDDAANKHCGSNAPWTAVAHRLFGLPSRRWLACGFNYSGTGVWLLDEICSVDHRRSFPPLGHGEGQHIPSTEGMTPRILKADEVDKERLAPAQPLDMLGSPMSTSFDANLFSSEAPLTVGGILGQLAEAYLLRSTTDVGLAQERRSNVCTEADLPLWRRGAPIHAATTDRAQLSRWLLQEQHAAEACTLHRVKHMRCILRASELHRFAFLEGSCFDNVAASIPRRRRQMLAVLQSELPGLLEDWISALDPMKNHVATTAPASSGEAAGGVVVAVTSATMHQLLLMVVEFALCLVRASWVHRSVSPLQQARGKQGTNASDSDSEAVQAWMNDYSEEFELLRDMTTRQVVPMMTKIAAATGSACQSPKRRACFGQLTSSVVRLVAFTATLWLRPEDPSAEAAAADDLISLYPLDARRQIASTYAVRSEAHHKLSNEVSPDIKGKLFVFWKETVDALSAIRCSLLALRTSPTDEVTSFAHRLQLFVETTDENDAMMLFNPTCDDAFDGATVQSTTAAGTDLFAAWDAPATATPVQQQERILTIEEAAVAAVPTTPVYDEEQRQCPDGAGIRHQRTPSDHTRVLTPTRGIVGGAFDLFAMAPVTNPIPPNRLGGAPS